jgi:hypothetical protein
LRINTLPGVNSVTVPLVSVGVVWAKAAEPRRAVAKLTLKNNYHTIGVAVGST